jgi:hypothetical protein
LHFYLFTIILFPHAPCQALSGYAKAG